MGYTHYFYQKRKVTDKEWTALTRTVKALIRTVRKDVPVRFEYDSDDAPLFDTETIRFNGVGDDGHETFVLTREQEAKRDYVSQEDYDEGGAFSFCKTARKPYDILVVASLLAAQYHAPGVWSVGSDGEPDDWEDGLVLISDVLGVDKLPDTRKLIPTHDE